MLKHLLIAALRNMNANRLQSGIAIFGLAVGLWAAIIAGLVLRSAFSVDSFIPSHERLYWVGTQVSHGGQPTEYLAATDVNEAARLQQKIPGIEAIARLGALLDSHTLSRGQIQDEGVVYSADPNIFDLLRLPVLYGDLQKALARPDAIVISLSQARKYFGADNVVGQTLIMDKVHPMRVAAVIADLPPNSSTLQYGPTKAEPMGFMSGKPAWSDLAVAERQPDIGVNLNSQTLIRLAQGASPQDVRDRIRALRGLFPQVLNTKINADLISVSALDTDRDYSPGVLDRLAGLSAVALVVLLLASINFITLMTARAARRAVEVGVRKSLGAGRGDLILQFLGEAAVQALIALAFALAIAELTLPAVNAVLQTGALVDYGAYGWLALALVGGALFVGVLAGLYPAILLSAFRPALVLKGGPLGPERTGLVRQALVILQFCALTALGIGAGVVTMQYLFALDRTAAHAERIMLVQSSKCDGKFRDKVAALPVVESTACTDISYIKDISSQWIVRLSGGGSVTLGTVTAGPGLLPLFGQRLIAGRDLVATDRVDGNINPKAGDPPIHVIVNQTALRKLGIASPDVAIGHVMPLVGLAVPGVIVGVVSDFSTHALEKPVGAVVYFYRDVPELDPMLAVKLSGGGQAVTDTVQQYWNQLGDGKPFQSMFLKEWIFHERMPLLAEGAVTGIFTIIALLLGCLGLFGLSVAAAERRTKEIGIRKAMGGGPRDMLALLLWQFARPVLLANVIAWPLAFWVMNRWLNGFAYHIAMPLWIFPVVGVSTLVIALLTVCGQALLVARQKPVLALRYE